MESNEKVERKDTPFGSWDDGDFLVLFNGLRMNMNYLHIFSDSLSLCHLQLLARVGVAQRNRFDPSIPSKFRGPMGRDGFGSNIFDPQSGSVERSIF